ncbi:OX-2 membrane glycoprotein-like [Centropristis striata]|uniref:OX-2 membrane glycoprotein-like n=1 Tax=Centropristis striata TaxID=184440 RepID=UPI0027DEEDC0|nr:OX-2 membrane glycoprotein-like [Centropristis striata]
MFHFVTKMSQPAVLCLLCALGLFEKGLAALIETQQTVLAAEGEEAQLNCKLMQHRDVLQVTWQKILPDGEKNLATYGKNFGLRINKGFQGKLKLKYAAPQNCSIVIREVMGEDEGCYRCLFNTYPEGALIGTTCLRLYELHGPVLHVRASDSPEETVVSCWATGGPAPTVTLTVPHYNSSRVTNSNGTVTVTTTALLSALHHNTTQVNCTAHVSSGPHREVSTIIPAGKQSSDDGSDEDSGSDDSNGDFTLITSLSVTVICVCAVAAIIIFLLIRKRQNRDSEDTKTPQKPTNETHGAITPLMKPMSEVRLRLSSGKKNNNSQSPQKANNDTHEFITALMKWISEVWLWMSSGGKYPRPPSPQRATNDTHEVRTPLMTASEVQVQMSSRGGKTECSDQRSSPSIRRNLEF